MESRNELNAALHNWQFDNLDVCLNKEAMFLLQQGGYNAKTFNQMSKKHLYLLAQSNNIKGRSKMSKDELITALCKLARSRRRR